MNEAIVSVTFPPSVLHPRGNQQYYKMAGLNAYRLNLPRRVSKLAPGSQELKWWLAGWDHGFKTNPVRFITSPPPQRKYGVSPIALVAKAIESALRKQRRIHAN